jgi:hypothetical protein
LGFFKGSLEIGDKFFINKNVGAPLAAPAVSFIESGAASSALTCLTPGRVINVTNALTLNDWLDS